MALAYEVVASSTNFTDDGAGTKTPAPGNARGTSTALQVQRAYYQLTRLLAYIQNYVIGGYAEAHTEDGVSVPAGPTAHVERHHQ